MKIIRNGKIYDGSGAPYYYGDILIEGGKIKKIGYVEEKAPCEIDVAGKAVCPGFIDLHTHSDLVYLIDYRGMSKVTQGVTTEVTGNCGASSAPALNEAQKDLQEQLNEFGITESWSSFAEYMDILAKSRPSVNLACQIGHGALRKSVIGMKERKASSAEIAKMCELTEEGMQAGAIGVSSGLIYPPSVYGDIDELAAICEVVAKYKGLYATHMRNESGKLMEAVEESLTVGRKSGVAVQISHHKVGGEKNWGLVNQSLALIHQAREQGLDVTCDVYPYIASSTSLSSLIPSWVHDGGKEALLSRLADSEVRQKLLAEVDREEGIKNFSAVMVSYLPAGELKKFEGLRITEIGEAWGKSPEETVLELVLASNASAMMIRFGLDENDVQTVLKDPLAMVGSDGSAYAIDGPLRRGKPHPRNFGSNVRVLGKYARDEKIFNLETAIFKMSGFPAWRIGLSDRGLVKTGFAADLVVFDPETVNDSATFLQPFNYAQGIEYVFVNGELTVAQGEHSGQRAGQILRKINNYQ